MKSTSTEECVSREKYTPQKIAGGGLSYTIPIYQRLFEWNVENIETLLGDLKKEFEYTNATGDYYIGMLTATKDNELVDGQQRFTVMMLLGSVLKEYYPSWGDFLEKEGDSRLRFSSRPNDDAYLRSLIVQNSESSSYQNLKMRSGYERIKDFMNSSEFSSSDRQKAFAEYVYQHLCFFVSILPDGYSPQDLNRYFERMNTSGKNLEQHEILKVKLLSNLDKDQYMLLWNKLADMDTLLIRRRKDDRDNVWDRKKEALSEDIDRIIEKKLINGLGDTSEEDEKSIEEIEASTTAPKVEYISNQNSRSVLSFPELLLQVLYRMMKDKSSQEIHTTDFFKPSNLISTFEQYLPFSGNSVNKEDIQDFMERLVKARLALDICFVRLTDTGYSLDMNMDETTSSQSPLLMFQSMLYVSSSIYTHYRWFGWLMDGIDENKDLNPELLYETLKSKVDKEFKLPSYEALSYGGDNRYWFWRLDFYIWEHRNEIFKKTSCLEESSEEKEASKQALRIAEQYVFRRNRSIEHVAPQTPQGNSEMKWEDTDKDSTLRDSFGNLVMISQGLNSSLKNESYEIKKAHVESYYNASKWGSIESLKLLVLYWDYPNTWTKKDIEDHGKKMYEFLTKDCQQKEDNDMNSEK